MTINIGLWSFCGVVFGCLSLGACIGLLVGAILNAAGHADRGLPFADDPDF